MRPPAFRTDEPGTRKRTSRGRGAMAALLTLPLALAVGCGEETERKFRQAAFGQIESGVKSILDGLVTGFFAINGAGSGGSSSTTTGTER